MENFDNISNLMFSVKKIERDQGVLQLRNSLTSTDTKFIHFLESELLKHLKDEDAQWESKHGALLGSIALISNLNSVEIDNTSQIFLETIHQTSLEFLTDSEVRIRLAAGDVLGSLCGLKGSQIFEKSRSVVLTLIHENLERDVSSESLNADEGAEIGQRRRHSSSDASQIFHDTAGWKCLETSMKCLQCMVEGCGEDFKTYITDEFLTLLFKTLSHTNRFVRETGYYVLGSLVTIGTSCQGTDYNPFEANYFGHHISKQLGIGLSDNWSQVRLASSECARKFLLSFKSDEEREVYYPELLPKMCLNRYYIADGVRIYSQESWNKVVKDQGRTLVKNHIQKFVDHYVAQTRADNHAVREAACACIAELASKIDPESTKPYVSKLLQTLLDCFSDDSWPVRDAACLASGNFVLCYPNESRLVLDKLYPLFYKNLGDTIPSVRQGAAGALGNVAKAYGMEAFQSMQPTILNGLKGVENQASESEKYIGIDKGPATFGVVKKLRDNDLQLHSNQQMYSCGSLAPKMGRGGGCSDHSFKKPSEPWELADGCIHLIAELSAITEIIPDVCKLLPLVEKAVSVRHYTHHVCLLETLCKQLPNICKGIGKKLFKQYMEMFLEAIFYSLSCENILTSAAANQCLVSLSTSLGPNIFRARIENFNPRYLSLLDDLAP